MFTFEDQGGRSITLRPEGTAPICRAYVEHGMHKLAQPVKLWYLGPFFRHERPQAGRYRQFHQVGAEAIGSDSPLVDAELIMLLADLLDRARRARVSSCGSAASARLDAARDYREELRAYLREHEAELSKEVRERIDANPLRAFDADDEGTQAVMADGADAARPARGRGRRALRRGPRAARRRRRRLRARRRAWCAGSTTTRAPSSSSTATSSAPSRRSAAAAATTAWSSSSAARRPPAVGWAAGIERILLAIDAAAAAAGRRRLRRGSPTAPSVHARDGAAGRAAPRRRSRPSSTSAVAGSRAS